MDLAILKSIFATIFTTHIHRALVMSTFVTKTEDFEKTINIKYFRTACRNLKFPLAINFNSLDALSIGKYI